MPSAPPSCRRGVRSLTVFASRIVSMASQSSEYRLDIVGALNDGSKRITRSRLLLATFILIPTMPMACREPFRRVRICSIFCLFQGSFHAAWLAIKTVFAHNSWSLQIVRWIVLPVSVTSTMRDQTSTTFCFGRPQETRMERCIHFP